MSSAAVELPQPGDLHVLNALFHDRNVVSNEQNIQLPSILGDEENVLQSCLQERCNISSNKTAILFSFPLEYTKEPLLHNLARNQRVLWFLRVSGMVWTTSPDGKDEYWLTRLIQTLWNFLSIRLFLAYLFGSALYFFFVECFAKSVFWAFSITIVFQISAIIPSFYTINYRLSKPSLINDLTYYNHALLWSWRIFIMTSVLASVYPCGNIVYYGFNELAFFLCDFLSQLSYSIVLSVNMLFVLLDCRVATVYIDELINLHKNGLLTVKIYNAVRSDIDERVQSYLVLNYLIFIVGILNLVGILIILLFGNSIETFDIYGIIFILLKELPFLVILFLKSAEVNEKSDTLNVMLGTDAWEDLNENNIDNAQFQRLQLYANADARKISFPLAGLRFNYNDLNRQIIGWILAAMIAVVRGVLDQY
eukprot:gene10247-13783_t